MADEPMHPPAPRAPLPAHEPSTGFEIAMTHDDLVDALRQADGLVDVSGDPPAFHFRGKPFLHFHTHPDGTYADVRFDSGDFEPVWASTPIERVVLLARVLDHLESHDRTRKRTRGRDRGRR